LTVSGSISTGYFLKGTNCFQKRKRGRGVRGAVKGSEGKGNCKKSGGTRERIERGGGGEEGTLVATR